MPGQQNNSEDEPPRWCQNKWLILGLTALALVLLIWIIMANNKSKAQTLMNNLNEAYKAGCKVPVCKSGEPGCLRALRQQESVCKNLAEVRRAQANLLEYLDSLK